MSGFRAILVFLLMLPLVSCDTPVAPTYARNQEFTLAPGGTANISGTTARVRFDVVVDDFRCPVDVACIQAGDALVRLQFWSNTASGSYDLHTGNLKPGIFENMTIWIADLTPYPISTQPTIVPKDYRVTLLVK